MNLLKVPPNSSHNVIKMTLNLVLQSQFEMLLGNENLTAMVFESVILVYMFDYMILISTIKFGIAPLNKMYSM